MQLICINCPKGCELNVTRGADGSVTVTGHTCPRGKEYGIAEMTNPTRMVTGLVRVAGTRRPLPVKTRTAIPKGKIAEVTNLLANTAEEDRRPRDRERLRHGRGRGRHRDVRRLTP